MLMDLALLQVDYTEASQGGDPSADLGVGWARALALEVGGSAGRSSSGGALRAPGGTPYRFR